MVALTNGRRFRFPSGWRRNLARVQLEQVSKVYPGDVQAVAPMDLDIAHGEFTVLVGPSGCGKSTTLRMIAGLEDATTGTIRIGDRVVNDVEPRDRNIAMVFQSYALYPHMTVRGQPGLRPEDAEAVPRGDHHAGRRSGRGSWASTNCWTASPAPCPAASGSGWPWAAPSCAIPTCSCSTNP